MRKITIPMECPKNCTIDGGCQNSLCFKCPVFLCRLEPAQMSLSQYRKDWLKQWESFFAGKIDKPNLYIFPQIQNKVVTVGGVN